MKHFLSVAGMFVMMTAMAACGEEDAASGSGSGEGSEGENSDEKVELTYWYAWGDKIGENNENLVEMFNESQDDIHVTAEYQGTYDELHAKTQAAFAAGDAPEVTQNEIASIGVFAKSGMTEDLTPFVEEDDINMDDFNPGLMGNSYVDEKLYGLPYLRSTPILYLNTTMLEEKGLDPSGPETWDEFEEYAEELTEEDATVGASMPINIWMYEGFVAQGNGQMVADDGESVTFNEEAGVEALDFLQGLYKTGSIKIPTGDEAGDVAKQDFINQHSGMHFSSTADLSYFMEMADEQGFELDTAFMPANDTYGVPTGGANLVMTSELEEEKQEAAWEFIKWMTSTEQTAYASEFTGYLPSRLSAIETDKIQSLYEKQPQFKVAVDQLEYARPRPMEEAYPEISNVLSDELNRAILEEDLSSQEALDGAADKANSLLQ